VISSDYLVWTVKTAPYGAVFIYIVFFKLEFSLHLYTGDYQVSEGVFNAFKFTIFKTNASKQVLGAVV
jgi:hypothetical protein